VRRLKSEDDEGFLYRGQIRRFPPHKWTVNGEERQVEALYPADYRFHYATVDFSPESFEQNVRRVSAARAYGRSVRDQFAVFLGVALLDEGRHGAWATAIDRLPELGRVADGQQSLLDTYFSRMAWSLAQHYLIATALTDLTFSPRVAAWFATEPWDPAAPRPTEGERGVLYRIHKAKLESILARATELSRAMALAEGGAPAPAFFLVDIREIPAKFAKRPSAQQGASVYGFDQAHVIAAAFLGGAIDAFEFTHRSDVRLDVSREDVVPSEDPFLEKVARFHAFRGALATRAEGPAAAEGAEAGALDRANTVFNMGLIGARSEKGPLERPDRSYCIRSCSKERRDRVPLPDARRRRAVEVRVVRRQCGADQVGAGSHARDHGRNGTRQFSGASSMVA